jgi:antirestriction protein ArdC
MPVRSSRCTTAKRTDTAPVGRVDLYEEVTARIIAELEAGRVPWVQPWDSAACRPSLPRNAVTGRPYSGINVLLLWSAVMARGWPSQSWLTFRQAREAGGNVIAGEKGVTVVYADRFIPEAELVRAASEGAEPRAIPFLKRFTVFNVAQCEGLKAGLASDPAPLPTHAALPIAETLIATSGVSVRIGGDTACYVPALDHVEMPPQAAFFEPLDYHRTCFHELAHATGHASRVGRDLSSAFGSAGYAREELVAEIGSAFVCAALGLVPSVRHADYLAHWLEVLRADDRAIFRAASAASRAADWLLARQPATGPDHGPAAAMDGAADGTSPVATDMLRRAA